MNSLLDEILRVENLKKRFVKKGLFGAGTSIMAADDVSFSLVRGEVLVLAGESGSGKSTIAKMILGSVTLDSGKVFFEGQEVDKQDLKRIRMGCQMVHQDPYDSINPRMKIADIVSEPLEIHGIGNREEQRKRVIEVLQEVRLEPANQIMEKYPHMLSGGQRQRVVLARALTLRPSIILADEPVSMLDVSIRAEMLELMRELQKRHGISFLYITHDLATAKHFGQRIAVLYRGKIVEIGPINDVLFGPRHPYTRALIDAVSEPDPKNLYREKKIGIIESQNAEPSGCRFRARCPYAIEKCSIEPELEEVKEGHLSACYVELK